MKKTNYFSHDSNARNDDKILAVRMEFGAEGYGIYFMLLERLREDRKYMSIRDYNMIAFDFRTSVDKIKSIVEDFGLFIFTEDGKYFYSENFNERMSVKDEKTEKRSIAGRKGMAIRYAKKQQNDNNVITKLDNLGNNVITDEEKNLTSKVKESKVKESKVKEIKVKEKEKEKKEKVSSTSTSKKNLEVQKKIYFCIDELFEILSADDYWVEISAKSHQCNIDEIQIAIPKFLLHLQSSGTEIKSIQDAKSHFNNWLRKIRQLESKSNPDDNKIGRISRNEINEFIESKKSNNR